MLRHTYKYVCRGGAWYYYALSRMLRVSACLNSLTLSFIRQLSWFCSPSLDSLPWRGFMKLRGSRQSLSSEGSATMNGSTCCPPTCAIVHKINGDSSMPSSSSWLFSRTHTAVELWAQASGFWVNLQAGRTAVHVQVVQYLHPVT